MDKAQILIVDDDELARKNLTRLLQKEGFKKVSSVKNGTAAIEQLSKEPFDLLLIFFFVVTTRA